MAGFKFPKLTAVGKAMSQAEREAAEDLARMSPSVAKELEKQEAQALYNQLDQVPPGSPMNPASESAEIFSKNPPQAPAAESAEVFSKMDDQIVKPEELPITKQEYGADRPYTKTINEMNAWENVGKEPKSSTVIERSPNKVTNTNDFAIDDVTKDIPVGENEAFQNYFKDKPSVNASPDAVPAVTINESKLDEAIKKVNPSLWEKFKNLSKTQKIAVATSIGLGAYITKQSLNGGEQEQAKSPAKPVAAPKKEEQPDPVKDLSEEEKSVKEELAQLKAEDSAPKTSKSFVNEMLKAEGTSLGSDANLKEAQSKRDQEHAANTFGRAADTLSGALLHTGNKLDKFYSEQDEFANRHVSDIKDRIANEKNDPGSAVSDAYRKILGEFGVKIEGPVSAAAVEKIAPWVEKKYLAEESRKARIDELKLRQQELAVKQEEAKKTKIEANDTKRLDTLNKLLTGEIASSRSSFGRAANTYASSEKLEALVANRDPNSLDNREIAEVARQLDSILSNGQATISGMKKLIPEAASGDIAKLQEYLMSKRTGAGLGSFVSQMMKTVKREKELAGEQLKRTQAKIIGSYHDIYQREPDRVKQVLSAQGLPIDIFDQQKEQMSSSGQPKPVAKGKANAIPGSTVRVRGKLYKVGADGDSLEEIK